MSPQIEILEILLLFTAVVLFTFGIVGYKFNLPEKKYFKLTFAGVLTLSFVSLQAVIITYIIKFDIHLGWNAAILVLLMAVIVSSSFIFRIKPGTRLLGSGKIRYQEQSVIRVTDTVESKKVIKSTAITDTTLAEPIEKDGFTETSIYDNTKPFGITPDEIEQKPLIAESKPGESLTEEITSEPDKPVENSTEKPQVAELQNEKEITMSQPKKAPAKKRSQTRKPPAKKTTAKTKPRGKK